MIPGKIHDPRKYSCYQEIFMIPGNIHDPRKYLRSQEIFMIPGNIHDNVKGLTLKCSIVRLKSYEKILIF